MNTRALCLAVLTVALVPFFGASAGAQQLAKSGSINFHSGYKVVSDALTVANKTVQGHSSIVGVTFNDKGEGPLHLGPTDCFETFFLTDGRGKDKGYCAFGDADGDRIFTDWHGTISPDGAEGINEIVGGTGKFAGIQGSGPWKCKFAGANGEVQCAQRFDYRLP
jgi:hypothetical protein